MGPKGAAASGSSSRKGASSVCKSSASHTRLKSSLTKANLADDVAEGNDHTNDEDEEEEVDDEDDNDGEDTAGLQEEVAAEGDNDAPDENIVEDAGEENDAEDGGEENDADDGGEENDGDDDDEEEDDREVRQPKKRRRRQWELWSSQDKDIFFEAINECGKNFDSIQAFFQSRNQKKGLPASQGKNKDQVRHFYYRTWHKISKYISFAGNAKKSTQEIYGLVNYGEFRRRVGGTLDYKRGLKLRELVLQGTTSVRLKGRSIRIRTPQCRALKKFNQPQDESRGSEPLPRRISVLLSAGSSSAWTHVHSLAHNPRLRTALSPNRPLRDLLVFLQHKWRLKQLKTCASILKKSSRSVTVPEVEEPLLRLRPPPQCTVTLSRITQVTAEQPLCASLLSHESWLKKSGYQKTAKSKARRKEPKKLEEPSSKESSGAVAAADEPWDASQEETDYSDVEELGLQKAAKRGTANGCPDSQTSDEEHEANHVSQPEASVSSLTTRPRVHFSRNKSKGGMSLELCTAGVSNRGSAFAEATCLSSSNCDNLPKKRSLADARTGGAIDSDAVMATPKSRKRKSLKVKFASACDDSHDEAINDYYDTECDDEEVDEDDDNEEREGEKDEESKVKNEVPESKDGDPATSESVIPVQPLSVRVAAIRAGWTLASVGRLTVGELFVMLGRKNPLLLEYEFESFKKEFPASETDKNLSLCTPGQPLKDALKTEADVPNLKINLKSGISASLVTAPAGLSTAPAAATADLSGMLSQLLDLSQQLFHKNSLLDGSIKLCPCRLSKGVRSPMGGGSSRSPRMSGVSTRLPDACATAAAPAEKVKPSSAKRLIAPDDADPVPAAVSSSGNKRHCTRSSDAGSVSANTATDAKADVTSVATSRPAVLLTSQAKLEAEISALPRYCQRYKSRLSARKNVVVQRQLSLLPKQPPGPPVVLPARPRPLQPKPPLLNLNNCNIGTSKNLYVALPGAPNISLKIGCPTLLASVSTTQLPAAQPISAITTQPVQTTHSNIRIRSVVPTPTATIPSVMSATTRSNSILTPSVGSDSYSSKNNPNVVLNSAVTVSLPTVSPSENIRQGPRNSFPSLRWAASDHPNIIVGAPLEGLTTQEVLNAPAASKPISETTRHAAVPFSSANLTSYNEKSLRKVDASDNNDCSLSDILNLSTTNDSLNSSFLDSLCRSVVSEGITLHSSNIEGITTQTVIGSADLPATSISLSVPVQTPVGENVGNFTLSTPRGDFSTVSQSFGNILGELHTPKHESEGYRTTKAPSPESNTLDANVSFGVPCKDKINIVISDPIRSGNTAFDGDSSSLFSPAPMLNTNTVLNNASVGLPVSSAAAKGVPSVTSTDVTTLLHPTLVPTPQANNVQLPTHASVDMLGISLDLSNSSTGFSNLLASVVGATCPAPEQESSLLNTPPRPKAAPPPPTARPCTPSSPSRFVPRDDWMTGSVGDFSLTGLFDSIDPPLKGSAEDTPMPPYPQHGGGMGSHHPPVPQSASLLSVLNENGVDFTAKFDALASSRDADGGSH